MARRCSSTVEHLFCKQAVAGSNPIAGSILRSPSFGWHGHVQLVLKCAFLDFTSKDFIFDKLLRDFGARRCCNPCQHILAFMTHRPLRSCTQFSTARLCNGSTNDSDSFCLGSTPSRAANSFLLLRRKRIDSPKLFSTTYKFSVTFTPFSVTLISLFLTPLCT